MKKNNSLKNEIINKALKTSAKILLPEINDKRIEKASKDLIKKGFNVISLNEMKKNTKEYLNLISKKPFTSNWSKKMMLEFLKSPLNIGMAALDNDDIDCLIAGASHSTANVIRSAIRLVGVSIKSKWVSSSFLMISHNNNRIYTFADCGVIPDPNSEQLCMIAYEAAKNHQLLTNQKAKVAFLSFSTKGSAKHYKIKKVQAAVQLFDKKYPNFNHEGEIQFDAAINKCVSKRKIENSTLNGDANVFIFPDLDSGNIAYKITQYLAGYQAVGPLLQGLNKPIHDLSRGCTIDDIIYVASIACIQSKYLD